MGECFTQEIFIMWFLRSAKKCILRALNYLWNCYFLSLQLFFFLYLSFDGDFLKIIKYTILQNERMWWCGVLPSPTPIIFERLKLLQRIIYNVGKEIYQRVRIILNIWKIFLFRDFMSNFREVVEI